MNKFNGLERSISSSCPIPLASNHRTAYQKLESKMAISFKTRFTLMILLEVLTVTVLALAIAILASKEFPLLTVSCNFNLRAFGNSRVEPSLTPHRSKPNLPTKASRMAISQIGTNFITSRCARVCGNPAAHSSRIKPPRSAGQWEVATTSRFLSFSLLMPVSLSRLLLFSRFGIGRS